MDSRTEAGTIVYALQQQHDEMLVVQELQVDVCSDDEHGASGPHYHVYQITSASFLTLDEAIGYADGIATASHHLMGFSHAHRIDLSEGTE